MIFPPKTLTPPSNGLEVFHGPIKAVPSASLQHAAHRALLKWATSQNLDMALIDPGKPWQNGMTESFPGMSGPQKSADQVWASELGLSHEALYRTLRKLQQENAISVDGPRISRA